MTPVLHVSQRFPASRLCSAPVAADRAASADRQPRDRVRPRPGSGSAADALAGRHRRPPVHAGRRPARRRGAHRAEGNPPQPLPGRWCRGTTCARPTSRACASTARSVKRRAQVLRDAGPALAEKVRRVFAGDARARRRADVDASLYDGFIGDGDKRMFAAVRALPPQRAGSARVRLPATRACTRCCSATARATGRRRCRRGRARALGRLPPPAPARAKRACPNTASRPSSPRSPRFAPRMRAMARNSRCSMPWKTGARQRAAELS